MSPNGRASHRQQRSRQDPRELLKAPRKRPSGTLEQHCVADTKLFVAATLLASNRPTWSSIRTRLQRVRTNDERVGDRGFVQFWACSTEHVGCMVYRSSHAGTRAGSSRVGIDPHGRSDRSGAIVRSANPGGFRYAAIAR